MIKVLVPDVPNIEVMAHYLRHSPDPTRMSNFGPLSMELECRLAARLGVQPEAVLLVSSGTDALELALDAQDNAEYAFLPAFTFPATATAALAVGLDLRWVDVLSDSWSLSADTLNRALVEDGVQLEDPDGVAYAVALPVCAFGEAHPPEEWTGLAKRHSGLRIVVDAANAWGNQRVELHPRVLYCFSLHCTKNLSAGEGGLIVGDPAVLGRLRRRANFGFDLTGEVVETGGTNAKLSEYHAAVGLASLDTWDYRADRRRALNRLYAELLAATCPAVRPMPRDPEGVYTIYPVLLPEGRDPLDVAMALEAEGVQARRWYCPPAHRHAGCSGGELAALPVTEALCARLLCLPFHLGVMEREAERVVRALAGAL